MTWKNILLPLYTEEDFSYSVAIEGNSYDLRIYYNRRMSKWFMDLLRDDGQELLMGSALHSYFPISADYNLPNLSGFFWLQPKGDGVDEATLNPSNLSEYYNFFYMWYEE